MARGRGAGGKPSERPIERYEHKDKKRTNNPPVGLVTPETETRWRRPIRLITSIFLRNATRQKDAAEQLLAERDTL
jgi:hypothetical protein